LAQLTRSATADEAKDVCARKFDAYLGSNRTCEIGLNLATGEDYVSFVYLLEELTSPGTPLERLQTNLP
jgi:D-lactate dehydrogenase